MKKQPNILAKKIKHKLIKEIKKIFRGFEIVWEELDGCDTDGPMYWVECRNGFSSRSWNVTPRLKSEILLYLQKIASEGIKYNNTQYFLDPDIYFVEFSNYYSFVKPDFRIKIITKEEHYNLSPLLKHMRIIYERIETNMKLLERNKHRNHYEAHPYEYRYSRGSLNILYDIEKGFKYCLKNNEVVFENSFKQILKQNNCKDIDYIFSTYVKPFIRYDSGM
jgi:hypothetical protein